MKNFSFVKNQKIFFGIAILVFIIGIASFIINGFNLDVDFAGGTELVYDMGKTVTAEDEAKIETIVKDIMGEENFSSIRVSNDAASSTVKNSMVTLRIKLIDSKEYIAELSAAVDAKIAELYSDAAAAEGNTDTSKSFTVGTALTDEQVTSLKTAITELGATNVAVSADENGAFTVSYDEPSVMLTLHDELTAALKEAYPEVSSETKNEVGAEISAELRSSAILATTIAVILMLVYIAFRFQISSAFAAIVCLCHDIFVMLTLYSLLQIPVNSNIIAALLTILGYSINATIVIFDRIRENEKSMGEKVAFCEKVDNGIKATLWRSFNTTLTTLFTIGMIYIMGVTSIKNFALPIIVGIFAGLFSSVCLAGPLWNAFKTAGKKIRK